MDPYVYQGTDVLINRRGIRDHAQLRTFESDASARRLIELRGRPLSGTFDISHLRNIHRHIFQDVYPWAGEIRTVNISRSGQFPYAFPQHIANALHSTFSKLQDERYLASLGRERFATRAAHYLGEINAVHPFREGNGRTQREFIRQLAQRNGYAFDWARVPRDRMYEASRLSFERGDNSGLEAALLAALRQDRQKSVHERAEAIRRQAHGRDREDDRER